MPFVVLPRLRPPSAVTLDSLAARLCPYADRPREVLATAEASVLATPLVAAGPGRARAALDAGTAGFELRVEGATLVVRTDPLGTFPIWYARTADGWLVSPEAKALAAVTRVTLRPDAELLASGPRAADWSPFADVQRLPPGAALRLERGEARVEGAPRRFDAPRDAAHTDDWPARLAEALGRALPASALPTAAYISGGIDSSVACALARRQGPVASFSLGSAHGNEFADAGALADGLGTLHREITLEAAALRAELERVVVQNEVFDGLTAEILLQFSALDAAAAGSCRRVVTGYGSDLLFDGMLRHAAYMEAVGLQSTAELIERTRWTGELAPFVAWSRGLAVRHVFWDPGVMDVATRVPRELLFVDGVEKRVLREAATRGGLLPEALAYRKKTGLSDGTGCNRLFSEVLGLSSPHAYPEKSRWCLERLRRALAR
jgi:carbapenam-3-carboxylate synthase